MKGLLVGFGSVGRRHLTNLHDLGVREWALVHTGRGSLPVELPAPATIYANLGQALQAESPAFAVIANPTSLHVPTAQACLDAGCHVLLEKPVSHSLNGLERLAETASSSRGDVLVGFQFRFHPALQRMAELLKQRTIGAPLHARVYWGEYLPSLHPWEDWRAGYAAVRDLGGGVHHTICHPFDYLRSLFGDPVEVQAALTIGGPLGLDVAEAADVLLRFDADITAQVRLDYWSRPSAHRVEITCVEGTIDWDYMTGAFRVWDAATGAWHTEDLPGVDARNDLFIAEASHFLDVVDGRARPACTLEDGIAVVRLCTSIERDAAGHAALPSSEA